MYYVCQENITNRIGLSFNISQSTDPVRFLISWKVVMAYGNFSEQKRKNIGWMVLLWMDNSFADCISGEIGYWQPLYCKFMELQQAERIHNNYIFNVSGNSVTNYGTA
jgi:hypothetical protein